MERYIDKFLIEWKLDNNRKVLLLRGARQVGKTYAVRKLAQSFRYFVEINFEEDRAVRRLFSGETLDPFRLCELLSAYYGMPISPNETLIFFDEIQTCPEALSSLRFFREKMPEQHVVAAGSLLEFVLEEIPSMGVGRIRSLFLYPMTFDEYLIACEETRLLGALHESSPETPLEDILHRKLVDHFRTYQLIGGLPEVIKTWLSYKNYGRCFQVQDDLLITLQDDFAKYKKRSPLKRLNDVFTSIVHQSGGKFKYSVVDPGAHSSQIADALDLLIRAGLAYRIIHTASSGIPLAATQNPKKFKVILFDCGLYQRMLNLNVPEYVTVNEIELVNKGSLAETCVGQLLIAHTPPTQRPALYYWHREARGSNAEVDYVIQRDSMIIPIEVKAATRGAMQSLYVFLEEKRVSLGVRVSLENFSHYGKIDVYPLYAVGNLCGLTRRGRRLSI